MNQKLGSMEGKKPVKAAFRGKLRYYRKLPTFHPHSGYSVGEVFYPQSM